MRSVQITLPLELLKTFCQAHQVRELALFGSVLRDDFGPSSDVDLLVEFGLQARVGFVQLAKMQRELSALLNRSVDLVPKGGLKPYIRETVLNAAEVIYAA